MATIDPPTQIGGPSSPRSTAIRRSVPLARSTRNRSNGRVWRTPTAIASVRPSGDRPIRWDGGRSQWRGQEPPGPGTGPGRLGRSDRVPAIDGGHGPASGDDLNGRIRRPIERDGATARVGHLDGAAGRDEQPGDARHLGGWARTE